MPKHLEVLSPIEQQLVGYAAWLQTQPLILLAMCSLAGLLCALLIEEML